jgi:cytochrome P450
LIKDTQHLPPSRHLWKIGFKICAEREAQGPGQGDFVDRLIELKKRHMAGEFPAISSDQITGQSIAFILAGFETTANTLSCLTYNLVKNPVALENLVAEVEGVLEAFEGRIDQDTIADMPYLEAAIKESLRLFPPVFRTDRVCIQDWQEDGLFIPKGAIVLLLLLLQLSSSSSSSSSFAYNIMPY